MLGQVRDADQDVNTNWNSLAELNAAVRENFKASIPGAYSAKGQVMTGDAADVGAALGPFTDGQALTVGAGGQIEAGGGVVPIGTIILWPNNGPLPSGWDYFLALDHCFPIGAGGAYAVGDSGGAASINLQHSHTLSAVTSGSDGPSHSHTSNQTGNESAHTHAISGITGGPSATITRNAGAGANTGVGTHTHTWSGSGAPIGVHYHSGPTTSTITFAHTHALCGASNNGGSATQATLPPYMALFYIVRTS